MSVGEMVTEAHEMIQDAMETWIRFSLEDGGADSRTRRRESRWL